MASKNWINNGWTCQRAMERVTEVLREEGVKSLWFKILGEIVYRRLVLMKRHLSEPIADVTPRLPVVIDLLRENEVDEYIRFRPEVDPSNIRRRLDAKQWCFVARYKGQIVHAGWAFTQRACIDYLACDIRLASDEVYIDESFTLPDFRGKNLAPAQRTQAIRYFRNAGYQRILAVVLPENKPAFRPLEKVGFHRFGVIGYMKIGPWQYYFCRGNLKPLSLNKLSAEHGSADGCFIIRC